MTISSERISELKELAGKATPGKRLLGDSNYIYDESGKPICVVELSRDDDAELIAALDLSPPVVEEGEALTEAARRAANAPTAAEASAIAGAALAASPSKPEEGLTSRLAAWFNALPDGGMGKEHFDALLAIVGSPPVPEPQAVAWRYRYEETGEDNEMIWSDWIVVKWKPNRSVFSTKVEIEPLAPLSGGEKVEVTEEMVRAAEIAVYGLHERGFICRPLIDPIDMRAALTAALSTMGGKP